MRGSLPRQLSVCPTTPRLRTDEGAVIGRDVGELTRDGHTRGVSSMWAGDGSQPPDASVMLIFLAGE